MSESRVLGIAQQIWDEVEVQKIVVHFYPDHRLYSIRIAVGFAITRKEHKQQNRKFNAILKLVHKLGYFLSNEEDHPPNVMGPYNFHISMSGDIGMCDDDPYLIKTFTTLKKGIVVQDEHIDASKRGRGQRQKRERLLHG